MSLIEAGAITGGELKGEDVLFSSVSTDTRTLAEGELFIALQGESFDGNDYLGTAGEKGAVAAIVNRFQEITLPQLKVDDTTQALGQLGASNRSQTNARVLGITGSQGKTTVKEMVAAVLSVRHSVLVTHGNLNNHLGVPLTLLEIESEHDYAVIEMGANAGGEIAYTTLLVKPDIAHITNVAGTHLEGFGSIEGVAGAKAEIWDGLDEDGVAVINLDDVFSSDWLQQNATHRCVLISAGGLPDADYSITDSTIEAGTLSRFVLNSPQGEFEVELQLLGRHNQANALAAAALAMEAGADIQDVQQGLKAMQPVKGRMAPHVLHLSQEQGKWLLIDDSYNASPASFRAAIDVLAEFPGRHLLVAGDMGELGESAEQAHREIGDYARSRGVDVLLAIGELSRNTAAGFGESARLFTGQSALMAHLQEVIQPGDTVLVKGSRSAKLDVLINNLRNL